MTEDRRWSVGVVIPARDEEDRIGDCLRSVCAALDYVANRVERTAVVVVADSCADGTADRASAMLRSQLGSVLVVEYENAGSTRRAGTEQVMSLLAGRPSDRLWLCHTDADSTVTPTWIADQLDFADDGAHAVAGVVEVDDFSDFGDAAPDLESRFVESYGSGTSGAHPHVHATNLGIRADAYDAAGGWPHLAVSEDQGLWRAVRAAGYRTLSDRRVRVTTSGRSRSRCPGGFADALNLMAGVPTMTERVANMPMERQAVSQ